MPRQVRLKGKYITYHVVQRGNEKKDLFRCDADRIKYLQTLSRMMDKYGFELDSYCLMSNHVHLLIYDNGSDISQVIKSINISYAYYFNHKYGRVGHLFQDRFFSEVIQDNEYLIAASAYIHNNPAKAGITAAAQDYDWSSYKALIGFSEDIYGLTQNSRILGLFSDSKEAAGDNYNNYVPRQLERGKLQFLDVDSDKALDSSRPENRIGSVEMAEQYLKSKLQEYGIQKAELFKNRTLRNEIILHIKRNSYLKLNEIADLTECLSHSTVCRIVNKSL